MDPESMIGMMAVILLFGGPCVTIIVSRLFKMIEATARGHQETMLRMKMVDRGYSAGEIERVCRLPIEDRKKAVEDEWVPLAPSKPVKA